jgi:copper(I)-binding protein
MRILMRVVIGIALVGLLLFGLLLIVVYQEKQGEQPVIRVSDAVVTLPSVPGRPGAAYFTLHAMTNGDNLIAVRSRRIGRIELHETMRRGAMSGMRPLSDVPLGAEPVRFEPGGKHAMLFDVDPSLRAGDRIALTFLFERAEPRTVEAEVRGPGDVFR